MHFLGNLIWIIFGGLASSIAYLLLGLLWCVTILGIPFGLQSFKFASLVLSPFGKQVVLNFDNHPFANLIWLILGGFVLALVHFFVGILFCITIIGIPFGCQSFKLAKLAIFPFGAIIQ